MGAGHAQTMVPTTIKTHSGYACVDRITPEFIINLIYNDQLGSVYDIIRETGTQTWEGIKYLPVPLPEKSLPRAESWKTKEASQKVCLQTLRFLFVEISAREGQDLQHRVKGPARWVLKTMLRPPNN